MNCDNISPKEKAAKKTEIMRQSKERIRVWQKQYSVDPAWGEEIWYRG